MNRGNSRPRVRVTPRGARRIRSAHPWVFQGDVAETGSAGHGDVVTVVDGENRALGHAFFSSISKITLRMVGTGSAADDDLGPEFWARRIATAVRRRDAIRRETEAVRLVFGESDGIPGLVVDRYGEHLVVQALTTATERLLPVLVDGVLEALPAASVLARNDPSVRTLEGLDREVRQLRGTTPERIEVRERALRFVVDPWKGQKTGAFLDQRENRWAAAAYARGRVLDAFCYQGSFAVHASASATEVVAVDVSAEALRHAQENAALNDAGNVRFVEANVFDDLRARERRGETFELVWLDPPAFAKSRADLGEALRGYKEINLRAMKLLPPGGILVSSSCSYHLGEEALLAVLSSAAADVGRTFHVREKRTQSKDHPIRLGFPESHYLKCVVLELA